MEAGRKPSLESSELDDDVYYYTCWRLKLEGETENMESSELDRDDTPVLLIKVCCLQPASGCVRAQVRGARGWRR